MISLKKDVFHQEQTYLNWKKYVVENGIEDSSKTNSKLLMDFVFDMEQGLNLGKGTKKGGRSFKRLNVLRLKLLQVFRWLEKKGIEDISKTKEKDIVLLNNDLRSGKIKRQDGKEYEQVGDYTRNFKVFWNWWIRINRKKEKTIYDICEGLDTTSNESKFVYFTKEQLDEMIEYLNEEEQLLALFLFDSLIRFPTECLSLRVKDVYHKEGNVWINISDEISKVKGRTFNLLFCGEALEKYIKKKELKDDDYIFNLDNNKVYQFNTKLKEVAVKCFGDKISNPKARGKYSEISGYDFRHSGAIYLRWLSHKNSNISLDAIRERGGWIDFKMLNRYTQFIGLSGEIKKEALLIEEDKTRLEKKQEQMEKDFEKLAKEIISLRREVEIKRR